MKNDMMDKQQGGLSKLELLRKKRSLPQTEVNVEKAIDGFASSIDTETMMAEIAQNSAVINFMVDRSGSMDDTSTPIANEINNFALRQATKLYSTKISLTLFDHYVESQFSKVDVKSFTPISPWLCPGGTNIYDAIITSMPSILPTDANHKLHLIITDGQNGSSNHSLEDVRRLISSRINAGEHIFLLYNDINNPCSQTSSKEYAASLGIKSNNAVNFNRNGDGIKIIFQAIEDLLDGLRTDGAIPNDWSKAISAHLANPLGVKAKETKFLSE
ncbi:MAG: VWA domain-containing protein [Clostridia bacterium]|nr:VWA domain-containing protein [Clostridia bacterium]